MKSSLPRALLAIIITFSLFYPGLPSACLAGNGIRNLAPTAYEAGLGGAGLALTGRAETMFTNPAGLVCIENNHLSVGFSLNSRFNKHRDSYGNNASDNRTIVNLPTLAYARNFGRLTLGLGAYQQGSLHSKYNDLLTAYGTRDKLSSRIDEFAFGPAAAWQATDNLSLGVALYVAQTRAELDYFPRTFQSPAQAPPSGFVGYDMDEAVGWGYGAKLGFIYKPMDNLTVGMTYTTKIKMDFQESDITFAGFGENCGELKGLDRPRSLGLGVAVTPMERLLLVADLTWINWSDAIKTVRIKHSLNADVSQTRFEMDWKDQIVIALGAAYDFTDSITGRIGYNYAANPVPSEHLSPFFPAITEHHVTAGLGFHITDQWTLDTALEYGFANSATYTNLDTPFGANAREKASYLKSQFMVSYRW